MSKQHKEMPDVTITELIAGTEITEASVTKALSLPRLSTGRDTKATTALRLMGNTSMKPIWWLWCLCTIAKTQEWLFHVSVRTNSVNRDFYRAAAPKLHHYTDKCTCESSTVRKPKGKKWYNLWVILYIFGKTFGIDTSSRCQPFLA